MGAIMVQMGPPESDEPRYSPDAAKTAYDEP